MKYIQLMDCTMRDGGWVNEFSFGTEGMRDILQTVEDAGVEFVELGYLDQVKGFFHEGSMYKNLSALSESFSGVERREGTTRLVMIDYGKFDVEKLSKLGQDEDRVIDGIRLCFHKKDTKEALELGKKILDTMENMLTDHRESLTPDQGGSATTSACGDAFVELFKK